jgi:putative inorganic carbon (HCO3(-)) transporter
MNQEQLSDRSDGLELLFLGVIHLLDVMILGVFALMAIFPEEFPAPAIWIGLALLAAPFGLRKALFGRFTASTPANAPLLFLLLVMAPVAVWVTPAPEETWPALLRLLWSIALFYTVINWRWPAQTLSLRSHLLLDGRLPAHLVALTIGFLVVGVIFTLVGLLSIQQTQKIPELTQISDALSQFAAREWGIALPNRFNTNRLAGSILLYAPLAWALLLAPVQCLDRQHRLSVRIWAGKGALSAVAILLTGALLLSQSRGAWIAFGVSFVLLLWLIGHWGRIALAILLILGVGIVVYWGPLRILDQVTILGEPMGENASALDYVLSDRNLSGRFGIWQRAAYGIVDAPLTGVGLDAFGQLAQQPYPLPGFQPDPDIGYAHNMLLQIALDLGIPGLLAYLLLLGMVLLSTIRLYRRAPAASLIRFWSAGILASLVAHLLWGITDAIPLGSRTAVGIWYLCGLGIAAGIQLNSQA